MIPGDLASRLRMLTEASFFSGEPSVAPLTRVKGISERLPEFTPGQRITASLHDLQADNTFRARVDGREVILSLPESVKAGDTLELVVNRVTPQAVFASVASAAAAPATPLDFSPAGRLISFLLTGQPAPETPSLAGGRPLLPSAPQDTVAANQLAARLGAAVAQSGLFYESHQARWLAGQVDTASLRLEPQGQFAAASQALVTPTGREDTTTESTPALLRAPATDDKTHIPDRLLPLVHQQLDFIATHQLVWQGQVWPGQNMEWEIEDPQRDDLEGGDPDAEPYWNTTLRLHLPSLGGVEARLHLTPAGVAIRLITDQDSTRRALSAAESRLAEALAGADLPLTGMVAETRETP